MESAEARQAALGRPLGNLPLELTSFIGREREVAEVERLLGDRRLVTLYGPGGAGKTRLTLAVAQEVVEDFEDGVWWVDLAPISDAKLVPLAVATALGVREVPDRSLAESLAEYLGPRRSLVVLDNCEHLIEDCARLVDTLVDSCEHLRVMSTSREGLGITDEVNWVVPSLTTPDTEDLPSPESLTRYESVRLFVERARSRAPGFALTAENAAAVADICRKLDGIPLAIELATARMGTLSVEQISERLEDALGFLTTGDRTRPPRQRTLRAALQWGYELLGEGERELFGRLSVFVGGWTLEAAERVGSAGGTSAGEVLDVLSRLVDQSLVVAETADDVPRYRMLEPIRQYALELLERSGEAPRVRDRHAALFTSLAEQAHTELRGPGQVGWMRRIDQEQDNLRAAMAWALSSDDYETAALLGWALWPFWFYRGFQREGRRLMERVLGGGTALPLELRIRATVSVAVMAYGQGDDEAVVEYMTDLLELASQVGGDTYAEGYARAGLGLVAMNRGDLVRATARLEEALANFIEYGELWTAAQTHTWLGTVSLLQGDREHAVTRFEEGLALARWIGDRAAIYNALYNLAQVALGRGEHELAASHFVEGMGLSEEMKDLANVAYCLEGLATVAGSRGKADRSARLFGAAQGLHETIGVPVWTYYNPDRSLHKRTMADLRTRLGEQTYEVAFSEGRAMSPERAIEYALEEVAPEPPASEPPPPPAPDPVPVEEPQVRLRIFALGPARVEKDGVALDSPDWIQKSRELLYYLLSHPEGRTKEQIGLALLPEASTAQLRSSFHDTVYRLRRALGGKEWVAFEKRRYAFGRSLDYSYDVEPFEESFSEGRRLQTEAPDLAVQHLQKAADLYGGDFLEDVAQGEWAFARQDELRRAYGESLLLLGGLLLAQGRHAEAAEAYRKATVHDRFLEEAHRGLMRSQAALGERGRALRHYEELVVVLEEQLGASPAPETTTLYDSLRSGRSALGSVE
jgi:predicted ATPase/DNA-binding SARP family transcriptional activator